MKKGKIIGLIVLLLFLGGMGFGISQMVNNPDKYNGNSNQSNIDVLFDAPFFSRISTDALNEKMGEANSVEDYSTSTSRGNFDMKLYSYQKENSLIEFIVYEDAVVRVHFFPNKAVDYNNESEIFAAFGITKGKNINKTADTGTVLRFQTVSDSIGGLDIYEIDKKAKVFEYVYITYNWNYFE